MKSIDKEGMDLQAFFGTSESEISVEVRVVFKTPLNSMKDARPTLVEMHNRLMKATTIMPRFGMMV